MVGSERKPNDITEITGSESLQQKFVLLSEMTYLPPMSAETVYGSGNS